MSQDTRKDKRAKVVSLNVRYKSATVDEFIENHSHDVSKGGLFVKTPTPFPPGTLLKFEIRLAGDKSVISGVGRVVWKREPTQAGAEKPAGMGVKFIKIDDSSRAIIDRLITQKADAGSAYTSEAFVDEAVPIGHPSTLRGLTAATPVEPGPSPGPAPITAPAPTPGASPKLPVPPAATGPAAAGGPPPPAARNPAPGGTLAGPRPSNLPNVPAPNAAAPAAAASSKPAVAGALSAPKPLPRPLGAPSPSTNKPAPGAPAKAAAKPASEPKLGGPPRPPPSSPNLAGAAKPASEPRLGGPPRPPPSAPSLGGPPRPPPPQRKQTMMGMGVASTPPPPAAEGSLPATTPPPPHPATATGPVPAAKAAAEPMFPRLDPESGSEPLKDQTVMKQAAELLEEALKEAGGSLDEIGNNPLFQQTGEAASRRPGQVVAQQSGDTMVMSSPLPSGISPSSALGGGGSGGRDLGDSPLGIGASSPSQPLILDTPRSKAPVAAGAVSTRKLSDDLETAPSGKKKGGSGALIGLLFALLLVGGGVYAWQTGMLTGVSGGAKTPPSATTTAPPPASAPPSATASGPITAAATDAAPGVADAAPSAATTDAGTSPATSASASASAGSKPPPPPVVGGGGGARPVAPRPPRPPPTPAVTAEPTATATATATAEPPAPAPPPPAAPAPTPTAPPAPTMEPWAPQ